MEPFKIGRYQVTAEIGRGGMATVYRAYDPHFNREVAIKVLPREFLHDPTFQARFQREARIIGALEHMAIVPVHDFDVEDGQPYLVMRLMTGGSLEDKIRAGKIPLAESARILAHIAPALDEAHAKGVVHRDMKPGNILFDQHDQPYLSDFGIARLASGTKLTNTATTIGTPAYMSPEQGRGDPDVDGRSDIYALGAILFEMLSGRVPYESETPTGQIIKHITEPIPNILELCADLPADLQRVIDCVMAKKKGERYATVAEMAKALKAICEGQQLPTLRVTPDAQKATPEVIPLSPIPHEETVHRPRSHSRVASSMQAPTETSRKALAEREETRRISPEQTGKMRTSQTPIRLWAAGGAGLLLVVGLAIVVIVLFSLGANTKEKHATETRMALMLLAQAVSQTAISQATSLPKQTDTPLPTNIQLPSTDTPLPTTTPWPTNTPRPPTDTRLPPTNTPRPPTSTSKPTRTPTRTTAPTPQPNINNPTNDPGQCTANTHLTNGMYAFAQTEVHIYNLPRYASVTGLTDPVILYTLRPGDRIQIEMALYYSDNARNPSCYRKSYFWRVHTAFEDPTKDPGIEGWAFEYYYVYRKDDHPYWPDGYKLGPFPP